MSEGVGGGPRTLPPSLPATAEAKMIDSRMAATATLLQNGDVLITGGVNVGSSASDSAELYDPTASRFIATGKMTSTRSYHTATLLRDGKVLIAGGLSRAGAPLDVAELYDPATGKFIATAGKMTAHRYMHTATLLQDGRVLITGGVSTPSGISSAVNATPVKMYVLDTAELYDPATGKFTSTGNRTRLFDLNAQRFVHVRQMIVARASHTATLLGSGPLAGRVLIAGGMNGDGVALDTAELYNPADGSFTATGHMTVARKEQTATPLQNGDVVIAGGADAKGGVLDTAELYDPATRKFSPTGNMSHGRYQQAAVLLRNGRVLMAGGGDGSGHVLNTADLYDPASSRFTPTGKMIAYRTMALATLLQNGEVLVAGGFNLAPSTSPGAALGLGSPIISFRLLNTGELYDPTSGAFKAPGPGPVTSPERGTPGVPAQPS